MFTSRSDDLMLISNARKPTLYKITMLGAWLEIRSGKPGLIGIRQLRLTGRQLCRVRIPVHENHQPSREEKADSRREQTSSDTFRFWATRGCSHQQST